MKGTARPGAGGQLEASEKDRAELAMITDLLRNDLAQVCRPRSVRVAAERRVLELPYALQTVSDVVGELEQDKTPLDVLATLHPGGSVTGAPKRAAINMIRELEGASRGLYCGSLGFWTGERSTFSLLIRMATRTPAGWIYGVGGGIVFDSDPREELEELETKLGVLRCPTRSCA
jgi:para-aminobenzoate synthetase/4-amino-4-deoxychorismate lyase